MDYIGEKEWEFQLSIISRNFLVSKGGVTSVNWNAKTAKGGDMIVFQSKEALESCLRMFGLVGTLQNSFAVVSRIAIVGRFTKHEINQSKKKKRVVSGKFT